MSTDMVADERRDEVFHLSSGIDFEVGVSDL